MSSANPSNTLESSLPFAARVKTGRGAPRSRALIKTAAAWGSPLLLPLLILGAWQAVVLLKLVPPILLPSPAKVVGTAFDMAAEGLLFNDLWVSLRVVLLGFFWGSLFGLAFGAYAGLAKPFETFLGPTFDSIRQIPPLALIPFVILWAGVGDLAKIIVISKAVFFPIFLNTIQGIRGVGKEYVEVGKVLKLTRWQFARKVIIPGALPSILVGIRYGAGFSWSLVVAAELISGHEGLGYLIQRSQELLFTDQMFVAVILIAAIGLILDRSLKRLERHLLRWKQGYSG